MIRACSKGGGDGGFVYGAAYCFIQETEYWNESQYIGRVRFQADASISTRYNERLSGHIHSFQTSLDG